MKIKTKVLTGFLKKFKMTESESITEAIFKFEKEGLKIRATSPAQLSQSIAWLKTNAFDEYEEIGNIGVNDLSNVVKVLERFGEVITLKKEGNVLTVKGEGKTVDIELINENFITSENEPVLEFTDTFDIKATKLKEIIKDVMINKDAVITVKTAEKSVMFTNTGKYKFSTTMEAPMCKGGVKVSFGEPFVLATAELDGNLQISVRDDFPCKVMEKTETSVIVLIIAPRVETQE